MQTTSWANVYIYIIQKLTRIYIVTQQQRKIQCLYFLHRFTVVKHGHPASSLYQAQLHILLYITLHWGRRVIGISGSLIWSKTLMELIFNPYGEFHLSSECPVSQIHSPHLQDGTPGIFSDLLRSVQTLKRSGVRKATGSYCIYSSLVKLQPWFLSSRLKTCLWAELQPWCLSFQ